MKDLNKYILGILKKMVKNHNIRKTEKWTECKKEMISILTKKIQKIKVDQHFKDVDVNDFHMGIYSSVSWFNLLTFQKNIFPDKSNGLGTIFLLRNGVEIFLNHPPTYVRTFSLHKLRENCHFLDHPPTPMSLRNIKMAP